MMDEKQILKLLPKMGDKTIGELVIDILTEEWPLSAKGILNRVRRQHAREVSFQGVHKAIKKLHSEEILLKAGRYYKLNSEWLKRLANFTTQIISEYSTKETNLKGLP